MQQINELVTVTLDGVAVSIQSGRYRFADLVAAMHGASTIHSLTVGTATTAFPSQSTVLGGNFSVNIGGGEVFTSA